jgi:hypothetical protein
LIFNLSENDRVLVPAMLFLLVPAGNGPLKNWGSGQNRVPVHPYEILKRLWAFIENIDKNTDNFASNYLNLISIWSLPVAMRGGGGGGGLSLMHNKHFH